MCPSMSKPCPNPNLAHLPERDLTTPSGKKLTLMNPAYMQRQTMNQYADFYGVKGKITSLKVLNPLNEPDTWERNALKAFEQGGKEVSELTDLGGQPFLRLIRPLITQKGCLKCHGRQGYKEGDVRGGFGVAVPMEPYLVMYKNHRLSLFLIYGLVWSLGLGVLFFLGNRGKALFLSRAELSEEREKVATQLRLILDSLREGVFGMDREGKATFVNPAAAQMLQYQPEELLHRAVHEQIHHSTIDGAPYPAETCPHHKTLREGVFVESTEEHFWRKDGASFPIRSMSNPIYKKGEVVGAVVTFNDASLEQEKRKLEQQLRQAQKMEAIGTLAGGIAHDFNNILTPILGYSELIVGQLPTDSKEHEMMLGIMSAGKRAKELVKQILIFSRQTEKKQQPVQIHMIIKEALKLLRSSIPSTITITQTVADCGLVMADPTQLHQLLMNLCTNAYHAMRETGGELSVSLSVVEITEQDYRENLALQPGPHVKLSIRDTGCGMTKEMQGRIFEPYFTTKKQGEGTGLGLSLVHGIVTSYNGHITVDSEPGQGTEFHVYLPQITVSDERLAEKSETAAIPRGSGTILVVDDEVAVGLLLREVLLSLGYEVVLCASSTEALEIFQQNGARIDLVLTDMTMPVMNGAELTRRIKLLNPAMPVVLCTGFSEIMDEEKAKRIGVAGYLFKPVERRQLAQTIQKALGKKGLGGR